MAEGRKTDQGLVPGCRDGQPLCLNWAGCDVFGGGLLDLDEADSELLDSELRNTAEFREDAKGTLFRDINVNRQPPDGRRVGWDRVRAAVRPAPRNVSGNTRQASLPVPGQRPQQVEILPISAAQTSGGPDLLELQKVALSSMKGWQKSLAVASTSASIPIPLAGGSDLLELQKMALLSMKRTVQTLDPPSNAERDQNTAQSSGPSTDPRSNVEGDLLELQKVALASMEKLLEVLESRIPTPVSGPVPQLTAGGDLLKVQRTALTNIMQNEPSLSPVSLTAQTTAPTKSPQQDGGSDLPSIPRQTPPAQIRQQGGEGEDLLELQKEALTEMSFDKGEGGNFFPEEKEGKRQFKTEGGGDTSSSSPSVFNKIPAREPLEMLLQELSSKDKALQSASRTIEEKDQLLQEYEASLANARNLLQCMNVRYSDAKEETAKVLTEAEEIFGNLKEACSAVEVFDSSIPQCAKGIHSLEEPSTAAPEESHFSFGTENGLETNEFEIDERRNLVEGLLRKLDNIEVARKEAQQGFELQIQRIEQLIAELQQLDLAHPVVEGATYDRDKNSNDQGKANQTDHAFENTSDQTKLDLFDQAYEDSPDQAKGHLSYLAHENRNDQLKEVESKDSAEIQFRKRAHQPKRPKYVARVSTPNALWEHLRHFIRKQPQGSHVETIELTAQQIKLQGDVDLKTRELQSQLEHRINEVSVLHKQLNEMRNALLEEQEARKVLSQKAIDIHPWPTKADLEQKDKIIRKMHYQMHQLEAALRQEREETREALERKTDASSRTKSLEDLALSAKVDIENLRASLHLKDEQIREQHEKIARNDIAWQAGKHQMMKCIDDLETKLLVKEEEVINLAQELEISRSSVYSQRPDELRFKGDCDVHFFRKQGNDEGREILDLRCEVLSLQDCLGIKTQAIKTMEKELARSYSIVTELRSKLRGLQECEGNSQRKGPNTDLIEKLRKTEEKLKRSVNERALMNSKIQDLSARCKYFEEFERLHREGSDDKKEQAIKELEKELERNVQIIKNMQARCNDYEARATHSGARNNFDPPERSSDSGIYDSWELGHTKLVQLSEEKEAVAAECEQLRSQMKRYEEENDRKGELLDKLQHELQNLKKKQIPISSGMYQQHDGEPRSAVVSDGGRPKTATTITQSTSSALDLSKVESAEVNTLRELLRGQWRVQKVMEDRINSMMAYVSDRVDQFEREHSDATSDSSFAATTELNHFHVEAKLMKLQLERQLEILRGTTFTSLPASGVASPEQLPQNSISTQNLQLLVEKNALEDSAQTLQEKTSRLLKRLTFMRTEFNPH